MRILFLLLLLASPLFLKSQVLDTAAVVAEADSLLKLARTLVDQQEPAKAFETNELAGSVILKKLGEASDIYISYLNQKAFLLIRQSQYSESEQTLLEALNLGERLSKKSGVNYVTSLDYLGFTYWRMSRFNDAEKAFQEALEIGERTIGKEHSRYLNALSHLANLYRFLGRHEEAKKHCLEILSISERVYGKETKDYIAYLSLLGTIYFAMGDLERAEKIDLEVVEITGKMYGKEHPLYASRINGLALSYSTKGNYEAAEPLLLEAKEIRLKTLGRDNVYYAETLGCLGNLYSDIAKYEQSEPYYLEARAILEKIQGKMNADYAMATNNNANLYHKMGKLEEAENLYLEALEIREKVLGKEHRFFASTLNNLANLYLGRNEIEKAEPYVLEAKAIYEKILEPNHYLYANSLQNLVNLYWIKGDFENANRYLHEACSSQQSLLLRGSKHLSEQELGYYANTFLSNVYYSFSLADTSPNPQFAANSYDLALFYKGYLQTTSKQMRRLVNKDTTTASRFDTLQSYQANLAKEYAKRPSTRNNQLIADLENRSERLEKELVQTVAGFGEANQQVSWQQVQEALQPGEAAIEFVRYELFCPGPSDTVMYAAIVLRPEETSPQFVPLATESQLEDMLKKSEHLPGQYINRLYSDNAPQLFQLIWQPLEQLLEDTRVVYYSPTGLLHRLNLSAITKADQTILTDSYQLIRLGSTRQLTAPPSKDTAYQDAILFGGIQYEMDSVAIFQSIETVEAETLASNTRGYSAEQLPFAIDDSTLTHRDWKYLRWTDVEIDAIDLILEDAGIKTNLKRGYAATEEAFKAMGKSGKSPSIIHLSTHGFFFPDPSTKEQEEEESGFKLSDHPMIRSGIILAGGNYVWQTGHALRPEMEDGVLTAFEISQLDLSNTELVVLSACETGLGDIQGNEGVYGLQRAFKIAGAKYLIMSLWQVPDFQTQELMTTFYLNWLEVKMSIPQAFSEAQASIRKKYPEPFYWAGFVLIE